MKGRSVMQGLAARTVLFILAITTAGYHSRAEAADKAGSRPGVTWASIQRLPDWSGVWTSDGGPGRGPPTGVTGNAQLTPKYAQIVAEANAARDTAKTPLENMGRCQSAGPAAILAHGVLFEYLFSPGRVTMLFEDGEVRRIHTDGRAHLGIDDLRQSYMGDSIGHWEGKTLVVDTIGFPRGEFFANNGVRATINTHMVERISMTDRDHMKIAYVITDPQIFSRPWEFTRQFKHSELPYQETLLCNTHDASGDVDMIPPPPDE